MTIKYFKRKGPFAQEGNLFQKRGLPLQIALIYVISIASPIPNPLAQQTHTRFITVEFKGTNETSDPVSNDGHQLFYVIVQKSTICNIK